MPIEYRVVKCRNCNYEWIPRVPMPIECPHCTVRNPIAKTITTIKKEIAPINISKPEEIKNSGDEEPRTNKKVVSLE